MFEYMIVHQDFTCSIATIHIKQNCPGLYKTTFKYEFETPSYIVSHELIVGVLLLKTLLPLYKVLNGGVSPPRPQISILVI